MVSICLNFRRLALDLFDFSDGDKARKLNMGWSWEK